MSDDSVRIPNREIYDRVVGMETKLDIALERLNTLPDHERRIRSLERWAWAIPPAVLAGLIGLVSSLVKH